MKRYALMFLIAVAALACGGAAHALTQRPPEREEASSGEQWEYLAVSGGTTDRTPSGNASLRKDPTGMFRESFAVETNLDKLGAKGWELVSVGGQPADPVYYFKRRK